MTVQAPVPEFRHRNLAIRCAKFDPKPDFKIEPAKRPDFFEVTRPSLTNSCPDFKLYAAILPGYFLTQKTVLF